MTIRQTSGRGTRYDSILDTVGDTPVVRINRIAPNGVTVYVKFEAFNPAGSVKDRLAVSIIEEAERSGRVEGLCLDIDGDIVGRDIVDAYARRVADRIQYALHFFCA